MEATTTTTATTAIDATTPPVVSPPANAEDENRDDARQERERESVVVDTPTLQPPTNAAPTPITANTSDADMDSSKSLEDESTGEAKIKESNAIVETTVDTLRTDDRTRASLQETEATNAKRATTADVIELLDDDDEQNTSDGQLNEAKRPRLENNEQVSSAAMAAYQGRVLPSWMQKSSNKPAPTTASVPSLKPSPYASSAAPSATPQPVFVKNAVLNVPHFIDFPAGFVPTWGQLLPSTAQPQPLTAHTARGPRIYNLSLLNVKEFSIEGLPSFPDGPPTPVTGLRKPLRQICRSHQVKPEYSNHRWRIPLAAYHAVATYLQNLPSRVYGIPANQLQIATLERERQDKGYPTPETLMDAGLPRGLAHALADFQRGGVDFVRTKGGRALVADDMGLGKTIQGVASMALYKEEWPVLILCPSGARYHWEHEFRHWLGVNSPINKKERSVFVDADQSDANGLLQDWQINVLTSSKDKLLPSKKTKVVICSYGLVVSLIQSKRLQPGMFGCAVVDESHMLKNKSSKRTCALVPILQQTQRCVLLSGTPALARPSELWPQLSILNSTGVHGWDISEEEYVRKYVKAGNRRAELHTMMTATVMIRRLKADMLENLPSKCRQVARVHVVEPQRVPQFRELLLELQQGKGVLGTLAKIHAAETKNDAVTPSDQDLPQQTEEQQQQRQEFELKMEEGRARIAYTIQQQGRELSVQRRHELQMELEENLRMDLQREFHEQRHQQQDERKKNVLSQLYSLTGDVKIPLIVDFLKRWLNNKTKGKICIFAHHISVLDAIEKGCRLDNNKRQFIRIDGSTSAKLRQEQIGRYQTNPAVRVALLGITAAGVAVTLTASSTVLFAELFWTPALMIQAEDRCHRIGQYVNSACFGVCWEPETQNLVFVVSTDRPGSIACIWWRKAHWMTCYGGSLKRSFVIWESLWRAKSD